MSDKLHDSDEEIRLSVPQTAAPDPGAASPEKLQDQDDDFEITLKSPVLPPAAEEPEKISAEAAPAAPAPEIKLASPVTAPAAPAPEIKLADPVAAPAEEKKPEAPAAPAPEIKLAAPVEAPAEEKNPEAEEAAASSLFADVDVQMKKTEKDIPVRAILLPDLPAKGKKSGAKWIFLLILLLIGGGCYVYFMQRAWFDTVVKEVKSRCGIVDEKTAEPASEDSADETSEKTAVEAKDPAVK